MSINVKKGTEFNPFAISFFSVRSGIKDLMFTNNFHTLLYSEFKHLKIIIFLQ